MKLMNIYNFQFKARSGVEEPCCFEIGYGSINKPCCLNFFPCETFESKCSEPRVGGSVGKAHKCPANPQEAAAAIQSSGRECHL